MTNDARGLRTPRSWRGFIAFGVLCLVLFLLFSSSAFSVVYVEYGTACYAQDATTLRCTVSGVGDGTYDQVWATSAGDDCGGDGCDIQVDVADSSVFTVTLPEAQPDWDVHASLPGAANNGDLSGSSDDASVVIDTTGETFPTHVVGWANHAPLGAAYGTACYAQDATTLLCNVSDPDNWPGSYVYSASAASATNEASTDAQEVTPGTPFELDLPSAESDWDVYVSWHNPNCELDCSGPGSDLGGTGAGDVVIDTTGSDFPTEIVGVADPTPLDWSGDVGPTGEGGSTGGGGTLAQSTCWSDNRQAGFTHTGTPTVGTTVSANVTLRSKSVASWQGGSFLAGWVGAGGPGGWIQAGVAWQHHAGVDAFNNPVPAGKSLYIEYSFDGTNSHIITVDTAADFDTPYTASVTHGSNGWHAEIDGHRIPQSGGLSLSGFNSAKFSGESVMDSGAAHCNKMDFYFAAMKQWKRGDPSMDPYEDSPYQVKGVSSYSFFAWGLIPTGPSDL